MLPGARQVRAARRLLDYPQERLADSAQVPRNTVDRESFTRFLVPPLKFGLGVACRAGSGHSPRRVLGCRQNPFSALRTGWLTRVPHRCKDSGHVLMDGGVFFLAPNAEGGEDVRRALSLQAGTPDST
jgi:hypothetical protein